MTHAGGFEVPSPVETLVGALLSTASRGGPCDGLVGITACV